MLELYIWGSGFGLPSLDAECLAAITYLHNALSPADWSLVPSNDPSISPLNHLPALRHDEGWISGFRHIVNHLRTHYLGNDLDENLSRDQKADVLAYSAFVNAQVAPLLDVSLYTSSANWSDTTRPALTKLLPFPLKWTVPPLLRAEAIKRTEHLGLMELDNDFDPNAGLHLSAGRDALPETVRRHIPSTKAQQTVREEMTPEQTLAIRLHGLAKESLDPLAHLLGNDDSKKPFFFGSSISSLDCLVFGYLALMRESVVPRPFLRDYIVSESPRLSGFIDKISSETFSATGQKLPWAQESSVKPTFLPIRALDTTIRHIPGIGDHYVSEMRSRTERGADGLDFRLSLMILGAVATGLAATYGYQTYKAIQPFGLKRQVWQAHRGGNKLASQFGELGSMLDSLMGARPGPTGIRNTTVEGALEVRSDVD